MKKQKINKGFEFKKLDYVDEFLSLEIGQSNDGYQPVYIPHDANISDFSEFYKDCILWYRRPLSEIVDLSGKYILYFEGVYMDASIYINDTLVGKWVNGYTSFWFDITEYLSDKENYLYVSVNYRCPNSRWYAGPGINRDVYLCHSNNEYIVPDSVYVCPQRNSGGNWTVSVEARIDTPCENYDMEFVIPELDVKCKAESTFSNVFKATIPNLNPVLWDIDNPKLYAFKALLKHGNKTIDEESVRFGFRSVEPDTDRGLFLNGRHIKLNGVCLHSDGGCLGTAFDKDYAKRQINAMKEMGANSIRLAHNVFAPDFLNLCDEIGVLVLDEIFDCWLIPKTEYDYARFFEEWHRKDIRSWVCRDRNHPCVIFWSAGNEIYDTHVGKQGRVTLNEIASEIRKYDYCGHGYVILASNYMAWDNTQLAVDDIKMVGYNYGENLYRDHHAKHPSWYIFGSETASCVQSRGIYHFPLNVSLLSEADEQCSSLGNSSTSWGAPNLDYCVTVERDCEFSFGQFLWAGIDYLGEPTPYHTKNSYFGMMDTAVFPKDAFFMFQSCWTERDKNPMIHILPYWDYNRGQLIDVRICSNFPEVELFLNGVSLGRKEIDHEKGFSMFADYKLAFTKGELKAVGFEKGGTEPKIIKTVQTSKETEKLRIRMIDNLKVFEEKVGEKPSFIFEVPSENEKLLFFEISAIDGDGSEVYNANDRIRITCSGACRLVGLDNGDSTDYESYSSDSRRLFSGKLLAVVRTCEDGGSAEVTFDIEPEDTIVRRLDLLAKNGQSLTQIDNHLTPENPIIEIKVGVCPQKAKFEEIRYQISSEKGVPLYTSVIEDIADDYLSFKLRALADSEFRLKVMAVGSDGRVSAISEYEFVADGFGQMNLNPFNFVYAAWYKQSSEDIGNGNENGISTSRDKDSWILYENLDFGSKGSDSVTMSIFELDNTPTSLTFWNGIPHADGSSVIGEGVYDLESIWNVYQDQTFKLNEVLKGISTFGIELHQHKIHLKGFVFEERNRTFERNSALDADEIYGDSFERAQNAVMNIGNNVSMVFKDLDFGDGGVCGIRIWGQTPLENNTIHLLFSSENNQVRNIIEFKGSSEFVGRDYSFEKLKGKWNLTFLFLPGSNFNFESFKFISEKEV